MPAPTGQRPPIDSGLVERLRSDLRGAAFSVDGLTGLWGEQAARALHRGSALPARRAARRVVAAGARAADAGERRDAALATLSRLFVLGEPVPAEVLAAALPVLAVDGAERLGLVRLEDGVAHPSVDLRPYAFTDAAGSAEWWIASDPGELALGGALPVDHVLGVGGATLTMARLLIQEPAGSVLDLGTGCGVLAMHASRFAARVVATDVSARAIDYARFNAELNGVSGIEFRVGDRLEPVAGERFDRVVSNPPFVITPRRDDVPAYEYRDGGETGDAFLASLVGALPEVLAPGGVAQLLGNWEDRMPRGGARPGSGAGEEPESSAGEEPGPDAGVAPIPEPDSREQARGPATEPTGAPIPGLDRAAGWAGPLDVWLIERDVQDPAQYAETWIRDGGLRPGSPGYDDLLGAWLDDFARRGVPAIGFGYLLLRRPRDGVRTLDRRERLPEPIDASGPLSAGLAQALADGLDAHDRMRSRGDAGLLRARLRVGGDVTEERFHRPGEADPVVIRLRQGGGFGRVVDADTALAALVGACDGELSVEAIIGALADLLETPAGDLRDALLPQVRELLVGGLLRFS